MLCDVDPHTPIYIGELDLRTPELLRVQNVIHSKGLRKVNDSISYHFPSGHSARGRGPSTGLPATILGRPPAVVWACDPKVVTLSEPSYSTGPADDRAIPACLSLR